MKLQPIRFAFTGKNGIQHTFDWFPRTNFAEPPNPKGILDHKLVVMSSQGINRWAFYDQEMYIVVKQNFLNSKCTLQFDGSDFFPLTGKNWASIDSSDLKQFEVRPGSKLPPPERVIVSRALKPFAVVAGLAVGLATAATLNLLIGLVASAIGISREGIGVGGVLIGGAIAGIIIGAPAFTAGRAAYRLFGRWKPTSETAASNNSAVCEFKFNCPHCDQHILVPAHLAGTTASCPTCARELTIPQP